MGSDYLLFGHNGLRGLETKSRLGEDICNAYNWEKISIQDYTKN